MRTAALALSLYALILAVVAGATWLGNGGHYGIDTQPRVEQAVTLTAHHVELVAIPVDQASPEFVGSLLEGGWHGIAGDGQEAIYAPREVALQLCLTDTDCELAEGLVQA
jgi:hypothetical protein